MILALEILAVLCMLTVMFVAIWGFIVAKQNYSQMKYQNYLLEKLCHNIYLLVKSNESDIQNKSDVNTINEDEDLTE